MTGRGVLFDASVVLKVFVASDEAHVEASRSLLVAHSEGLIDGCMLDLTVLEVANGLLRRTRLEPIDVAAHVADLRLLLPVETAGWEDIRLAVELAQEHRVTIYDALYAAVAHRKKLMLVSGDRHLLRPELAVLPGAARVELDL